MATIKSYTDIEQSKKLAEILPLESADMHHKVIRSTNESKTLLIPYSRLGHYKDNDFQYCVPCWSIAALFDILPDTITSNDGIAFKLNIKKHIIEYSNPSLCLIYKSVKSYNPMDACYEMILKLNELNLL